MLVFPMLPMLFRLITRVTLIIVTKDVILLHDQNSIEFDLIDER
jgi:hypothetical protein